MNHRGELLPNGVASRPRRLDLPERVVIGPKVTELKYSLERNWVNCLLDLTFSTDTLHRRVGVKTVTRSSHGKAFAGAAVSENSGPAARNAEARCTECGPNRTAASLGIQCNMYRHGLLMPPLLPRMHET